MNLVLARIDDRLVHGQVVVGCCGAAGVTRIVLINDEAATDPLQSGLYRAAVPPEISAEILELGAGLARLLELDRSGDTLQTLLVVDSPRDMRRLIEAGVPIRRVNLGGLHHRPGARELWSGYFATEQDLEDLRAMIDAGVEIRLQSVPGAPSADAAELLERS